MNLLREQRWSVVAVLVVVFLAGLSMHAERVMGWGFFILCFVVGSLSGLGLIWFRERSRFYWQTDEVQKAHCNPGSCFAVHCRDHSRESAQSGSGALRHD
jgi:hypothetical protein